MKVKSGPTRSFLTIIAGLVFALLIVFLGTEVRSEQDDQKGDPVYALTHPIRAVHKQQENTGFAFALLSQGNEVTTDFAGLAVLEHNIPITANSRFPIMSITKAFTGLALASAVAEGLVELDKPVATYLPDYGGQGGQQITLRQLALHISGVPHTGHPDRRNLYVQRFTSANASRSIYETRALDFAPGSQYGYSSSGYNLIAAVLERVSGENFKTYVETRVIAPLGLQNTGFDNALVPLPNRVRNYSYVDLWDQPWREGNTLQQVPTWDFSYNLGGGNMYSTVGDLARLGQALLSRNGLSAQVWDFALDQSETDQGLSPWSLGWIHSRDAQGRKVISITGATPGVQAALYTYPDDGIVFAALANCWCKASAGAELVIGAPQRVVSDYLGTLSAPADR